MVFCRRSADWTEGRYTTRHASTLYVNSATRQTLKWTIDKLTALRVD